MKGFSLIELMIVMVIISVLSAVGIPAYQDYIIRAKVVNLLSMTQPMKLMVAEAMLDGAEAKVEKIANLDFAKEISVTSNVISVVANGKKLGIGDNKVLKITLTPRNEQGMIAWKCAVDGNEFKKYVPIECRE